jgi:hypothetical protein
MSRTSYNTSRQLAAQDFPFYALLAAAQDLAVLNGDTMTAGMIRDRWSHQIEKRQFDKQVAGEILEMYPDADVDSLLMTAMRQADSDNEVIFRRCWPDLHDELRRRYHAPGGALPEDTEEISRR